MNDIMDRIQNMRGNSNGSVEKGNRVVNTGNVPIDGDLYATSEYLSMLSSQSNEFYRRYLDHIKYYTSLFRFEGHEDIERLNLDIMRQLVEFGKVGIIKLKGKPVVISIVEYELDMFKKPTKITGMATREGYGYRKEHKVVNIPPSNCVFIKENFQAIPFIFFWKDIIENFIKLRKAATTASIASIKKFKRNVKNNHSLITRLETQSMANPDTAYVENITQPVSYLQEIDKSVAGEVSSGEKAFSTMPNGIEFNSIDSNVNSLWGNLKEYLEMEYFQRGRRINTNKKAERNIKSEIDTETINFDILESELYNYLVQAAKELSVLFNCDIKITSKMLELEAEQELAEKGVVNEPK